MHIFFSLTSVFGRTAYSQCSILWSSSIYRRMWRHKVEGVYVESLLCLPGNNNR